MVTATDGPRVRRGLQLRVAATVVFSVLAATLAVAIGADLVMQHNSEQRFRNAALADLSADSDQAATAATAAQNNGEDDLVRVVANYLDGRYGLRYSLLSGGSRGIEATTNAYGDTLSAVQIAAVFTTRRGYCTVTVGGRDYLAVAQPLAVGDLTVVELSDLRPLRAEVTDLRQKVAIIAVVAVVITGLLGLLVARRILLPVRRASATARRVQAGDLSGRLPVRGRDELAELAASFNAMSEGLQRTLGELRRSDARQRQFVADVSHELRTPLASLIAAADSADAADPEHRDRAVQLLRQQSRRLASLIDDLLEISRFDAGAVHIDPEPVDLGLLARDAVQTVAGARADETTVLVHGDVMVAADPRRLHAVVRNLVGNAFQHGRPPVTVEVDGAPAAVSIRVRDTGDGVPAELAPVIFNRFTRGDTSRSGGGSTGLGLAIAAENAAVHDASLTVEPVSEGASFLLTVPRQPLRSRSDPDHSC